MTSVVSTIRDEGLLRRALQANGLFSIGTGSMAVLFAAPLGELMGISGIVLVVVGVGVVGFGVITLLNGRSAEVNRGLAIQTVVADVAWIAGAIFLLVGFPDVVTEEGRILIGAVSAVVGLFAVVQTAGLRRLP